MEREWLFKVWEGIRRGIEGFLGFVVFVIMVLFILFYFLGL